MFWNTSQKVIPLTLPKVSCLEIFFGWFAAIAAGENLGVNLLRLEVLPYIKENLVFSCGIFVPCLAASIAKFYRNVVLPLTVFSRFWKGWLHELVFLRVHGGCQCHKAALFPPSFFRGVSLRRFYGSGEVLGTNTIDAYLERFLQIVHGQNNWPSTLQFSQKSLHSKIRQDQTGKQGRLPNYTVIQFPTCMSHRLPLNFEFLVPPVSVFFPIKQVWECFNDGLRQTGEGKAGSTFAHRSRYLQCIFGESEAVNGQNSPGVDKNAVCERCLDDITSLIRGLKCHWTCVNVFRFLHVQLQRFILTCKTSRGVYLILASREYCHVSVPFCGNHHHTTHSLIR